MNSNPLNFRVPHCYRELESILRGEVNKNLERGKIDVSVFVDNSGGETTTVLNKEWPYPDEAFQKPFD